MTSPCQVQDIPRVPEVINFSSEEEKVLALWDKIDAFQTSLKQSKGKPRYSFYDGPPFATGLPHYGHILTSTIKDVVTRYAHQKGYHVERRFGWDTHGLPVEFEIDKALGIKGPADVEKMGIAAYNGECRKIVTRYVKEWEMIIGRIGRWIDFKNDYKSLYPWFMESVWWVFKQLYNKGLVYQGSKVMPYSPTCNTPLSNFESGQNYKDVVDPAVTVSLPIIGDKEGAALLIWTTTPWTLPSNLTACVNAKLVYARVQELSTKRIFILLESRVEYVFKPDEYKVLKTFPGEKLKGLKYKPIFDYFKHLSKDGAFTVLVDDYVTAESGTGVVHQAPYFGEDDYRVCLAAGIISRDQDPICPVDASGCFTKPVTDLEGQYFKDADKNIVAALKANGRLIQHSQVKHSYPFCWRSDTPLMYKAVRSWFIRVESMSQELQRATSATYWIPDFVRDKRFGNWLKDSRDWAVSRNRYWGTPIPLWVSPSGDEIVCIGSIAELEELTGVKVTDLHRESIDHLEIPSRTPGNPPLKRVPEVFDCWFESGSMPFAQEHYPFENTKEFEEHFPADFIAEGIDQTRGWFYTLIVISTLLYGQAPFKNLVANGLILASDGQKMSKRKKNYPDPLEIVNKYGADALRLYLINSPVVRAENLRFKEEGVRDIVKDVFLPWFNAFRFLMQNIEVYVQENNTPFHYSNEQQLLSENIMDKWMVSFTQSLLAYVYKEMELYHLYTVIPCLTKYIDQLTNWYVRMNRKRLKGEGGPEDCNHALTTLFNVLFTMVKIMAPFSPFLSETIFQYLRKLTDIRSDSVHYLMLPQSNSKLINKTIERAISRMQAVIELGRVLRDRKTVPIKYPLPEIVVIHQSDEYIEDVKSLESYVLLEMNVRKLTVTTDKSLYGIALRAEPDHKTLGLRLKQEFKAVAAAIKSLTNDEINDMAVRGYRDICGQRIQISEIRLIFQTDVNSSKYEVHSDNDVLVLLDMTPDSSMQDEGTAREIINRIQKLRKKAHLVPTDEIAVYYKATGDLDRVALSHREFIETTIKASFQPHDELNTAEDIIIDEQQSLKDCNLKLVIIKKGVDKDVELPKVKWVNILLHDIPWSRHGCLSNKALVLLEVGGHLLSVKQLKAEIAGIFGIGSDFDLWYPKGIISEDNVLWELSGNTIVASKDSFKGWDNGISCNSPPFCNFTNFLCDGVEGTIILENPSGVVNVTDGDHQSIIKQWVKCDKDNKKKIVLR